MRFLSAAAAAAALLLAPALAEDLLFIDSLEFHEYDEAINALGMTAKAVTDAEWRAMTTADFAAYKAIVIADPSCGSLSDIQFLDDTKSAWSPAVLGNVILIGTDPSYHFGQGGAQTLIDNAIKFAAAGKSLDGSTSLTGLYFALSCYYGAVDSSPVSALSEFGDFTVRGNLDCYNNAHIVATHEALTGLDDAALSDWSCSVHEAFSSYPSVGINGFQALAIAKDIIGDGSQTFGDGTIGLPYILSRGATPAGCGDGKWDASLGEECDDGNTVAGDGCSISCKCESGIANGDGTCAPKPAGNTTTPPVVTPTSVTYTNSSSHAVSYTTPFSPPPYITPTCPEGPKIIGIEIVVHVTVYEDCQTTGGSTITTTTTSACSTMHKPIYDAPKSELPCYICELKSASITCPAGSFLTVSTTVCPSCPGGALPTPVLPVIKTCSACSVLTLTNSPVWLYTPAPGYDYAVPAPTLEAHPQKSDSTVTYVASAYAPPPCKTCAFVTKTAVPGVPAPTGAPYVKPTTSAVLYTGGASGNSVGLLSIVAGALLAIPMLL
ncbi:hypothetical protein FGG08_006299 [Glutinoglossum americanum]|uniref:Uncharacterized protein n=1 Tax=Glutinoglossum americanum TaxID=1670608 RepID=A0A9P8KXM3_9PEZI|nr:hypothetical protein FGG08_006299 [Glutinoglossum americanum]